MEKRLLSATSSSRLQSNEGQKQSRLWENVADFSVSMSAVSNVSAVRGGGSTASPEGGISNEQQGHQNGPIRANERQKFCKVTYRFRSVHKSPPGGDITLAESVDSI